MDTGQLNQDIDPAANQGAGGRTFTQEDVNRIVQDRLAKDREKASKELGEREQELAQREFRLKASWMRWTAAARKHLVRPWIS